MSKLTDDLGEMGIRSTDDIIRCGPIKVSFTYGTKHAHAFDI